MGDQPAGRGSAPLTSPAPGGADRTDGLPRLTAIIPTRDRHDLLRDCLATLALQDADPASFEVVVVDDGSDPPLAPLVEASSAGHSVAMRCVRQEPAGLNAGRNRGADEARAPLLAYLDDDTLVAPGWVTATLRAFDLDGADAVAGRIVLQLEGPEPPWLTTGLRAYLSELDLGDSSRWLVGDEVPYGANCAIRAAVLDDVGRFRAGLDRVGGSLISNGELELFRRVTAAGRRIRYAPEAAVRHRVPAGRLTQEWFTRRARAQGLSDALLSPPETTVARLRALVREVVRLGRVVPILLRNVFLDRRGVKSAMVNARLWVLYSLGRIGAIARGN